MKANRMWLFSDVLEKNKRVFKVPVYQRNYDWTNIQCEKLFQDIMKAGENNRQHFTGTVVYIDDVNGGSGLNEVLIIDGQQRITTMYILLKALYDASKGVSARIEDEVQEVMFNRHCDEKYKVKLKPVKTDNEQLMLLIKDKVDKMDRNSNVYKNYVIFKNLIEATVAKGHELNDILEGIKKLEIVEIILDKLQGDEPQKIFESINSTGLELSLADLIRNYLLMDDENQDELYEEYWLEIEKNVGYRNLGDFVINFLNSQITGSVNSKNAYRLFKEHCQNNGLTELTFDVNSNFDFSNTKPGEMIFVGEHTKVSSWADLLAKTMNTAFDLDAETITDLATKDYSIPYATRIYISNDERKIRKPKQIDNSGIYFEANLSANGIISFIKDLLAKLQLDTDDFSFSLSEVPFDIDNEDTWAEGVIPVAKLFYNFVENLVEKELIDSAELENLKTKEYTKKLFQATDYPAIANNRTDNMGNSLQKRYRAKAINFNGSEIYVSTQFFDSDRDAVIDWYRSHL